jgi:pantoate--beta-alanine ligase
MSSRNRYLSAGERRQAAALAQSLELAADLTSKGERDAAAVIDRMRRVLEAAGITRIDYIALAHPETLQEVREVNGPTIAAVAAYVGKARLIDNRCIG